MHYFDFSATTKPSIEALDVFVNNLDILCIDELLFKEKNNLKKILNTNLDVIYTSGATEANNMAIKGVLNKYKGLNKHVITTKLEHSSVKETLDYLEKFGFIIDYVKLKNGIVDINSLKELINKDTVFVSIASVDSETGTLQPINDIAAELKKYSNIIFHSDITQSIGKVLFDLDSIDLVTFATHKIFGLKGIGCLLKRNDLELDNIIFGKRDYNLGLIKSFNYTVSKALENIDSNYAYVLQLNKNLRESLSNCEGIHINSNNSIPYIFNISIKGVKPETFQHMLEDYNIYVSTKSACSKKIDISEAVYAVTNNIDYAKSSIRISLSIYNTLEEVNLLSKAIIECYNKAKLLNYRGNIYG